jgi:SAM-dependent methyltransferase
MKYPENTFDSNIYADESTSKYYSSKSFDLADKYSKTEDHFSKLFIKYLSRGIKILDIGCGSGRDLSNIGKSGFIVSGADSSEKMIVAAVNRYPELKDKIVLSGLPDLPGINNKQNGILCSAVLQHIPDNNLYESLRRIRDLLKDKGIFIVSFPIKYHGINPETYRDQSGRLFHIRPEEKYRFLIERLGLVFLESEIQVDSLGRDARWCVQVWRKEKLSNREPLNIIDSVLREDSKVTTYKFALLRALAETASYSYNSAKWLSDGKVAININTLAGKWLEYYWPLVTAKTFIIQGQDIQKERKSDINFRDSLLDLSKLFIKENSLSDYHLTKNRNMLSESMFKLEKKVLSQIKRAIIQGPVTYSGSSKTGGKIFTYNNGYLLMPAELWQEFALMGRWIEDSIILRWADFSASRPFNRANNIQLSTILDLLLYPIETKRDVSIVKKILEPSVSLECVWSGKSVKQYDIDHALPFSIWRNNDIWNLFPADSKVNNSKRDKLPSRSLLGKSRTRIYSYWDMYFEKVSNLFLYQAGNFCGSRFTGLTKDTRESLFSTFSETVEIAAEQRGVERWEG